MTVVEDSADRVVLYLAAGSAVARRRRSTRFRDYSDVWKETNVVMITEPAAAHSVWVMWLADTWEFQCWYVNLQDPLRRTARGFDTRDHSLDIVIYPDGAWRWKDEEETELAIQEGRMTRELADRARVEGERVLGRWRANMTPFCDSWPQWRPDPRWPVPDLPDDWAEL